jgi:hypothetical protein
MLTLLVLLTYYKCIIGFARRRVNLLLLRRVDLYDILSLGAYRSPPQVSRWLLLAFLLSSLSEALDNGRPLISSVAQENRSWKHGVTCVPIG